MKLEPCPKTGGGVHSWLLSQANRCRLANLTQATAGAVLREGSNTCGRRVSDKEIADAVLKAFGSCASFAPERPPTPTRPTADPRMIQRVVDGFGNLNPLEELWSASTIKCRIGPDSEEVIDALFPADALLCCGLSNDVFDTKPREEWRGQLSVQQFIVPSPMSAVWGETQSGKPSKHTLKNTGPRRFLIVEFDQGDILQQAALSLHLAQYSPLALAVMSGGKSLHSWFYVAGEPEDTVRKFAFRAMELGADWRPMDVRCQFVRMPSGLRDNGKRQRTIFFAPEVVE
jgi:hypothetical protein